MQGAVRQSLFIRLVEKCLTEFVSQLTTPTFRYVYTQKDLTESSYGDFGTKLIKLQIELALVIHTYSYGNLLRLAFCIIVEWVTNEGFKGTGSRDERTLVQKNGLMTDLGLKRGSGRYF